MSKSLRWALAISLLALIGSGLVIAFMLSLTSERDLFERNFVWLFWVNLVVAAALLLVIAIAAARLWLRLRSGKFGSKLLIKLAGIFAVVGVVPGVLIYTVSVQFVSRSIETWFDAQVAGALDAGLALGRGTLEALSADLVSNTKLAAERLSETPRQSIGPLTLERVREQIDARDVMLLGPSGQVLAQASAQAGSIAPPRPAPQLLRQARTAGAASQLEGLDDEPAAGGARPAVRVRALVPIPSNEISIAAREERFLYVVRTVSPQLVANALAVQNAYREYQRRAIAQEGLRRMYIGTLTLALVLAVFGAVLVAAILGNQIARPLVVLADGVREVAEGDLKAKAVFASRDELGGLTRAFARMTELLADAREQVGRGVSQLEGARTRLQTILDALSAGVIVFDRQRAIDTVNPGATRILRQPLSVFIGRPFDEVPGMAEFAHKVWQRYELHRASPEAGERDHWQDAFELQVNEQTTINLLVRGAVTAERLAPDGVRRHHRGGVGAALDRLVRGGAAPGARDQEPADADPAVGRAHPPQARGAARRQRTCAAGALGRHHRHAGAGDEAAGRRVSRLRAPAVGRAGAARLERGGDGRAGTVRPGAGTRARASATRQRAAVDHGRRDPVAPSDPQSAAERL